MPTYHLSSTDIFNEPIAALKAIPSDTSDLDVNEAFLYLPMSKAIQYLQLIPRGITALDFSRNKLTRFTPTKDKVAELVELFYAFPPNLRVLNLSGNHFSDLRGNVVDFVKILKAIPATVTELDLSDNEFILFDGDLVQILAAIPSSVTLLNLGDTLTEGQLKAFKNLPSMLQILVLDRDTIEKSTLDTLTQLRADLPSATKVHYKDSTDSSPCELTQRINYLKSQPNCQTANSSQNRKESEPVSTATAVVSGAAAPAAVTTSLSHIALRTGSPLHVQAPKVTAASLLDQSLKKKQPVATISKEQIEQLLNYAITNLSLNPEQLKSLSSQLAAIVTPSTTLGLDRYPDCKM